MPKYIIHKDGAYNYYTTVADGACYESALTLAQVQELTRKQRGEDGMAELAERLDRAHATGCSGVGYSLDSCIEGNRAGPNESEMPHDEFIKRYLTLDSEANRQGKA